MKLKTTLMWVGGGVAAIIAYPLLVRYMRSSEARDKLAEQEAENEELKAINADPVLQAEALNALTSSHINSVDIQQSAFELREAFRYGWSKWNPFTYLPDKRGAYLALKEVSPLVDGKYNVPVQLSQAYALLINNSSNLNADCFNNMSSLYYDEFKFLNA